MENTRKHLKAVSGIVLALAGLSLLGIVYELIAGEINSSEIPAGSPDNILMITKIILLVISGIMLLPQTYVGIKGIMVAKNPDSSRSHILVAMILFGFLAVEVILEFIGIFTSGNIGESASNFLSLAVDAGIMFDYIMCAKAVARGA